MSQDFYKTITNAREGRDALSAISSLLDVQRGAIRQALELCISLYKEDEDARIKARKFLLAYGTKESIMGDYLPWDIDEVLTLALIEDQRAADERQESDQLFMIERLVTKGREAQVNCTQRVSSTPGGYRSTPCGKPATQILDDGYGKLVQCCNTHAGALKRRKSWNYKTVLKLSENGQRPIRDALPERTDSRFPYKFEILDVPILFPERTEDAIREWATEYLIERWPGERRFLADLSGLGVLNVMEGN